jgi:hypothetical protein
MNREELINLAKQSGFEDSMYGVACVPGMYAYNMEVVDRFAALVAAKEREACALVCESYPWVDGQPLPSNHEMARAVRERGQ